MVNLLDPKISFIIVSTENNILSEKICDFLYSRNYNIIPIKSVLKNEISYSYLSIPPYDDISDLKSDSKFIKEKFELDSIILKIQDSSPIIIKEDESETPLSLVYYDSQIDKRMYLHQGVFFTLTEKKKYFFPKKKEDLKNGMIIEYYNENKWFNKKVLDIDSEFEKMYKLLIKYEKIRVEC